MEKRVEKILFPMNEKPLYELAPGSYWVGDRLRKLEHVSTLRSEERIWLILEPGTVGLRPMKPMNWQEVGGYYDRASDQETRIKGDDVYFLTWNSFQEFQAKIRSEVTKDPSNGEVRCPIGEFEKYGINKAMTVSNVVRLMAITFHSSLNFPFEYVKQHVWCRVVRFPVKHPIASLEMGYTSGVGRERPVTSRRLVHHFDNVEYDFDAPPHLVEKGEFLHGSECVRLMFRGKRIKDFPLIQYENERTKVFAILFLFATYFYDGQTGLLLPNVGSGRKPMNFDLAYVFAVLNIYYGRLESLERGFFYY